MRGDVNEDSSCRGSYVLVSQRVQGLEPPTAAADADHVEGTGDGGLTSGCTGSGVSPISQSMMQKEIKAPYAKYPFFASGKCSKGFVRDMSGLWMLKDKVAVPN
eukprot:890093-Pelagomonas_calceolata.AAC.1